MTSTNVARTILGPLTTTFTADPACLTAVAECDVPSCSQAWQAQQCYSEGAEDSTDCWPPRGNSYTQTPNFPNVDGWGFYSPGMICPQGYSSACSATGGGSWDWPVQYSIFVGETAVGCCPTGYTCANLGLQTCISYATEGSFVVATCANATTTAAISTYQLPITTQDGETTDGSEVVLVLLETYILYAPLFQINWQSTDRLSSSSSSSSHSSSSSKNVITLPAITAPPSSTPTTTTLTPSSSPSSSGLSTAASAGVGVGVGIAAIAIAILAIFSFRRCRRHRSKRPDQHYLPELLGKELPRPPQELSAEQSNAQELVG